MIEPEARFHADPERFPLTPPANDLRSLLARAGAGDGASREALLAALYIPVRAYLGRRTAKEADAGDLADDLAQETLIRIAQRLRQCRATTGEQVLGWALSIARTQLLDHLRRMRVAPVFRLDDQRTVAEDVANSQPGADSALTRAVRRLLGGIPAPLSELLRLRVAEGGSWVEVGAGLSTTPAAAKRRFQRAQMRLRRDFTAALETLPPPEREALRRILRLPRPR